MSESAGLTESITQPINKTIEKLLGDKTSLRNPADSPEAIVEIEEKQYSLKKISDPESPDLRDVQNLLEQNFAAGEVYSLEELKLELAGKTPKGNGRKVETIMYVAKDQNKVVSALTAAVLNLTDTQGNQTSQNIYAGAYTVTDENYRRKGLGRELYISGLMHAAIEASKKGKTVNFAVGETEASAEPFWNKMGRRRIYFPTGEKQLTEVKYFSPMSVETPGHEILVPQHLMIDGQPDREALLRIVHSIYGWYSDLPPEEFNSEEDYQKYLEPYQKLFNQFAASIPENTNLVFLNSGQKEFEKMKGVEIREI